MTRRSLSLLAAGLAIAAVAASSVTARAEPLDRAGRVGGRDDRYDRRFDNVYGNDRARRDPDYANPRDYRSPRERAEAAGALPAPVDRSLPLFAGDGWRQLDSRLRGDRLVGQWVLARFDRDKSGGIDGKEATEANRSFMRLADQNKDLRISDAELRDARAWMLGDLGRRP